MKVPTYLRFSESCQLTMAGVEVYLQRETSVGTVDVLSTHVVVYECHDAFLLLFGVALGQITTMSAAGYAKTRFCFVASRTIDISKRGGVDDLWIAKDVGITGGR